MIVLCHLLAGAAIASRIENIYLTILLAFLSHYFLDLLPHIDYIANINERRPLKKLLWDFTGISLDFLAGILLVLLFSNGSLEQSTRLFIGAFFAILPDVSNGLALALPGNKILMVHIDIHHKIHFLKNKKISVFWRVITQALIVILAVIVLRP